MPCTTYEHKLIIKLIILKYNQTLFLVVVVDEGNTAAENGIEGSVSYVEKKNLGTVTTKQLLALEDTMEPHQIVEKSV